MEACWFPGTGKGQIQGYGCVSAVSLNGCLRCSGDVRVGHQPCADNFNRCTFHLVHYFSLVAIISLEESVATANEVGRVWL